MSTDPYGEESLERDILYNAFRNSESPEEALKVLSFAAGDKPEQALINLANNATSHAIRTGLANLLIELFFRGDAMTVLETIRIVTETDMACRAGHPEDKEKSDDLDKQ